MTRSRSHSRFRNWRDAILTPATEGILLAAAIGVTAAVHRVFPLSLFAAFVLFGTVVSAATILFLALLRAVRPIRRGAYSVDTDAWTFYFWRLHGFLCTTNLYPFYTLGVLPPSIRPAFYRMLGARAALRHSSIGGRVLDPYLVTVGRSVMIGDDVLLIPHAYSVGSTDILVLDQIDIGDGVVVGARCTLMPGVQVGANSMIRPMSLVTMNSKIPPNEIWEGIPARKVADVDRPISEAV